MEYRRIKEQDTVTGKPHPWHWCNDCEFWPWQGEWESKSSKPDDLALCPQCCERDPADPIEEYTLEPPAPARKGICFVIQPFDHGPFDARYKDTLVPAIEKADLEPYRVDLDPQVGNVIEEIENKIRQAHICLADISEDNPNVWYELGFAHAAGVPVVLICSKGRGSLPFDVRPWHVLQYEIGSHDLLSEMEHEITKRLNGRLEAEVVVLPRPRTSTDTANRKQVDRTPTRKRAVARKSTRKKTTKKKKPRRD